MEINSHVSAIIRKTKEGEILSAEEIRSLLQVQPHSAEAGYVLGAADAVNRVACQGKAEVHAQIGLNVSLCPKNCGFCAFAARNKVFAEKTELDAETVVKMGQKGEQDGANALFTMATADYPFEKFIEVSQELNRNTRKETTLIANVDDLSRQQAEQLAEAGYSGIYHAVRMGEGSVTTIPVEKRLQTVRYAKEAGLKVGTCVEPIGPEHTHDEIIEKILIGRDMQPCFSGAMRRVTIPGTVLASHGMISEYSLALLVAIVRLAMGTEVRGNCTHEPNILGAASGANLFWAEVGTNPRDAEADTVKGRGLDVAACRKMLSEMDFDLLEGPSAILS